MANQRVEFYRPNYDDEWSMSKLTFSAMHCIYSAFYGLNWNRCKQETQVHSPDATSRK